MIKKQKTARYKNHQKANRSPRSKISYVLKKINHQPFKIIELLNWEAVI
jgi:Txe/YoeB family toxin of Txe-Axe toxin-antitoxin module